MNFTLGGGSFLDSNSVAEYYTYVSNDTVYYRNNDAFLCYLILVLQLVTLG
ncbi:MAG: hypothetical protein IPM74_16800 [Crocinitomicaceae bacterium]|nr:hypothetical protein [Crocinitomicaceae bacterium]